MTQQERDHRTGCVAVCRALDEALDSALAERRLVGCVVLLAEGGEIIYQRAAGLADRETNRQMELETPLRFASLTKPFTTMAALKLVEAGELGIEDPITRYLPEIQPAVADSRIPTIHLRDLLLHTAGLDYRFQQPSNGPYSTAGISDGMDEARHTLEENIARIASVPRDIQPGTIWRYSVATDVLGAIIARVAGVSLPSAIDSLVVTPLGLGAKFEWDSLQLATPYRDSEFDPVRMSETIELPLPFGLGAGVRFDPQRIARVDAFPSGGAGMAGRARDVLWLLEAFRAPGFLKNELRELAMAPLVGAEAEAQGPGWGYGMIGAVLVNPAAVSSGASRGTVSWGGVYGSWWAIDRARQRTIVALTNTAYEGMIGQFAADVARASAR